MRTCSVDGCKKPHHCRGYCAGHNHRFVRYGTTDGRGIDNGAAWTFLHEIVIPYSGDECLIWPFAKADNGYARVRSPNRTSAAAHRIVCQAVNGDQPEGKNQVAHSCGRGRQGCVAPKHLRWATAKENAEDAKRHRAEKSLRADGGANIVTKFFNIKHP